MDSVDFWRPIDIVACRLFGRWFVGAQSVDGVLALGEKLRNSGYEVTYNLLGEHVNNIETIKMSLKTTLELIEKMDHRNYGNISCKPTLYGLAISRTSFKDALTEVVQQARKKNIEVEIDAENYDYLEDTFKVFSCFAADPLYKNTVRQAVQAHIQRIEELMDKYQLWDKNLRVVKGAGVYSEKESVVTQNKFLIKERYVEILRRNIKNGRTPFAATIRDKTLAQEAIGEADKMNGTLEIQTLYGPLGNSLCKSLLRRGHIVRIYIPFVDHWCHDGWKPYGLRRARDMRKLFLKSIFCR